MKQIGSLFEKYKKTLRPPQATVEKEVVEVVMKITKITLRLDQVSYSPATRIVKINAPSILKSELKKEKASLLKALTESLGSKSAPTEILV